MAIQRQQIDIMINSKTGDMKADVACGPGGAICESMLSEILGSLGGPASKEKKPEYFVKRQVVGRQNVKK